MYKKILLPIDLLHESSWTKALPLAIRECQIHKASLHIMTVVPDFGMSMVGSFFPKDHEAKMMKEARNALHKFSADNVPQELSVQHIVGHGTVYEEILRVSEEISADLIIMQAHRPELRDYLLGPNAARVVRHADCSVLVVR